LDDYEEYYEEEWEDDESWRNINHENAWRIKENN
jgi:hypothetical protein